MIYTFPSRLVTDSQNWNFKVWQARPPLDEQSGRLIRAANVTPLWEGSDYGVTTGPPCELVDFTGLDVSTYSATSLYDGIVMFKCPPRVPPPTGTPELIPRGHDRSPDPENLTTAETQLLYTLANADIHPNLQLTVDFGVLLGPGKAPGTSADIVKEMVQVYLGLTEDIDDIISTTRPTPIQAGQNLLGMADLKVRQTLSPPEFSTLGIFDVSFLFFLLPRLTNVSLIPCLLQQCSFTRRS